MTRQVEQGEGAVILRRLLMGAGFSGFSFTTSFTLTFDNVVAPDSGLPSVMELRLDSPWRFGDLEAWNDRVLSLGPAELADPDEAVLAFDLVRLRWSPGSEVIDVRWTSGCLAIVFKSGATIQVGTTSPDDSWDLVTPGTSSPRWSVTVEHLDMFVASPADC